MVASLLSHNSSILYLKCFEVYSSWGWVRACVCSLCLPGVVGVHVGFILFCPFLEPHGMC